MTDLLDLVLPIARAELRLTAARQALHHLERLEARADEGAEAAARVASAAEAHHAATRSALRGVETELARYQQQREAAQRALEVGAGGEAALRQVETCAARIDTLELEALEAMDAVEASAAALAAAREAHVAASAAASRLRDDHDPQRRHHEAVATEAGAAAGEAAKALPRDLLTQLHAILRRHRPATALLESGACAACHRRAALQHVADLRQGRVVTCDGCGRWLVPAERIEGA